MGAGAEVARAPVRQAAADLTTRSSNSTAVEALYTLKVQTPPPTPGFGASLHIDVFRLGDYDVIDYRVFFIDVYLPNLTRPNAAVHIGRAVFDGRF